MSEETNAPAEAENTEATVVDESTGETVSETLYANGKYKTVSDLEKGYVELQKSYSQKLGAFNGAPEDYELKEGVTAPEFLTAWGKENQLNNDGLNTLMEQFNSHQQEENARYQEEQLKALGKNATERLNNINDFLKANIGENHGIDTASAAGIESLEKLIAQTKQPAPAEQKSKPMVDGDKLNYMQFQEKDAHGNRRYQTDPEFRARVLQLRSEMGS